MAELDIRVKPNIRLGLVGARKQAGFTQEQLAEKAFMSRSQLAALEIGIRNANEETWKQLKVALKVKSVEELWEKFNYDKNTGYFVGDDGTKIKDPSYLGVTVIGLSDSDVNKRTGTE